MSSKYTKNVHIIVPKVRKCLNWPRPTSGIFIWMFQMRPRNQKSHHQISVLFIPPINRGDCNIKILGKTLASCKKIGFFSVVCHSTCIEFLRIEYNISIEYKRSLVGFPCFYISIVLSDRYVDDDFICKKLPSTCNIRVCIEKYIPTYILGIQVWNSKIDFNMEALSKA